MDPCARVRRAYVMTRSPLLVALAFATLATQVAGAQGIAVAAPLPFGLGESLEYEVRTSRLGSVGNSRMWIEGPVLERGVSTWQLRSEMEGGKGPIRASDRTASWIDPRTFSTLRFEKRERHLLSRSDERVTIDRATRRWTDAEGPSGELAHDAPLDELSFLYFLRTLPLDRDTTMEFARHFDAERNPTIVRVVGHDTLTTPAGIFRTAIVEMEVRDPKRYKGTGVIRLHISVGDCQMPVRIESRMPLLGTTTLTLTGWSHPPGYPGATVCGE